MSATLTESMLASLPRHLQPVREGKYIRAGCPFHGSDNQRSLSLDTETGRFQCFSCNVWGYTEQAKDSYRENHKETRFAPRVQADRVRTVTTETEPLDEPRLREWQKHIEHTNDAKDYVLARRIPLEVLKRLGAGVGELGGARRLILPHTDPQGRVVSLYGRRIDGQDEMKHYHLGGRAKGYLNGPAANAKEVWLTEGPFDALALLAAGVPNVASIFGVNGIRWDWHTGAERLVFAFDADSSGQNATLEHAKQAKLRGIRVEYLTPDEMGGCKDVAEAWEKGVLNLGESAPVRQANALEAVVYQFPEAVSGIDAAQYARFREASNRFCRDYGDSALAHGWTALELFGIPEPNRNQGGALWHLSEHEIVEITPEAIRGRNARGTVQSITRAWLKATRMPV